MPLARTSEIRLNNRQLGLRGPGHLNLTRSNEKSYMSQRKITSTIRRSNRLKDAVYREMFLLESRRRGSEMSLALALLHAWNASASLAQEDEMYSWLRQISPLCVKMIEDSLGQGCACGTTVQ